MKKLENHLKFISLIDFCTYYALSTNLYARSIYVYVNGTRVKSDTKTSLSNLKRKVSVEILNNAPLGSFDLTCNHKVLNNVTLKGILRNNISFKAIKSRSLINKENNNRINRQNKQNADKKKPIDERLRQNVRLRSIPLAEGRCFAN